MHVDSQPSGPVAPGTTSSSVFSVTLPNVTSYGTRPYFERLDINQPYYQEHGSGGGLVLTKVLFADGTSWEDLPNSESCMGLWYNPHKKAFVKPIELPLRQ